MVRFRSRVPDTLIAGALLTVALAHGSLLAQAGQNAPGADDLSRQLMDARPDRGQTVAPVFEGWEPNPDGTFRLYFGYMNRNWRETLDIPVGPNNSFSPGAADRGQPTHFLPRRHKQTFAVTVPKDFGSQTLVWTLSIRGSTEKVPGSLRPELQIDVSKDTATGNTPPTISVAPAGAAVVGEAFKLAATVTDDGLPKGRKASEEDPRGGPNVVWSKYRGPGAIVFDPVVAPVVGQSAATTAVFSQPGEYIIQALADDGSVVPSSQGQNVPGFACCWTTTHVKVTVSSSSQKGSEAPARSRQQ